MGNKWNKSVNGPIWIPPLGSYLIISGRLTREEEGSDRRPARKMPIINHLMNSKVSNVVQCCRRFLSLSLSLSPKAFWTCFYFFFLSLFTKFDIHRPLWLWDLRVNCTGIVPLAFLWLFTDCDWYQCCPFRCERIAVAITQLLPVQS